MATRKTTKARAKTKTAGKTTAKNTVSKKTAVKKTAAKKPAAKAAKTGGKTSSPKARPGGLNLSGLSVSLTVDDLQKSMDFYHHVLGFTITDRWERDGTLMGVEMTAGSGVVMLGQDDWQKGRDRTKGEALRLYAETTQDIDSLAAQIKTRGGALSQEPSDEPWGARVLAVEDPDGFKLSIFKNKKKGGR
jgi:uncharacterized glyoxalase superfamily protein PhnB